MPDFTTQGIAGAACVLACRPHLSPLTQYDMEGKVLVMLEVSRWNECFAACQDKGRHACVDARLAAARSKFM